MTEGLDLHLGVDKAAGFVGRALEAALRDAIRSGRLPPGARLPGSRSLAADLGISRGTVVQAYTQLIAEGWLTGTTGSGTRVADLPGAGSAAGPGEDLAPVYRRRRAELAGRLALPLEGVAAGLHALLPVDSAEQERALIARGRRVGVDLHGLHAHGYWREPGGDRPAALILGYAAPPPHAWSRALEALAEVVQEIQPRVV